MLVVRGRHFQSGDALDFHVRKGRIAKVAGVADSSAGDNVVGGSDLWLTPGLVDIQVNGYAGHDFCSGETAIADVVAVAELLSTAGVTAFCPTITTNSRKATETTLQTIARACEQSELARERVVGCHLEGPYISSEDGPRGAHPVEHVRLPDWDEFTRFQAASGGRVRLVTLAPELPGSLEFIAKARTAGIVVALGHHAATREQIGAAIRAGAVLSTHLGNGAHWTMHRHENYLWEQLAHDGLMASIIVDGHHLTPAVTKCFLRAKGADRLILISDAVAAAGLAPGSYQLAGLPIEVVGDGSIRLEGTPYLAGSNLKLCDAVSNLVQPAGATFAEAATMASVNPARLLGIAPERGSLEVGSRADFALFRRTNEESQLDTTIVGRQICHRSNHKDPSMPGFGLLEPKVYTRN